MVSLSQRKRDHDKNISAQVMSRGVFITGTDTGVGKTAITAALARCMHAQGLRVGVMKPIETGVPNADASHSDANRLRRAMNSDQPFDTICQYHFPDPIAPLAAAKRHNQALDLHKIHSAYMMLSTHYEWIVVEGVGGIMVPLSTEYRVRELVMKLQLPCIIVSRTSLGAVNHLLLTLEALQHAGIPSLAIVLNESSPQEHSKTTHIQNTSTIESIRVLSHAPVFGPFPYDDAFDTDWDDGVGTLQHHPAMQALAHHLTRRPI
ncbi:MAG: ATP-dependent dethiobiotin synthetase BioD [Nitrospirales bacterium]|nr:MAG: ATP-dependent dethiobiotin synthetase BioD [Nitrospirales bacterium]